jgi:H+/Cl- antiporter ClcA
LQEKKIKLVVFIFLSSLITGSVCAVFLYCLSLVTDLRTDHKQFIWGLPLFGLLMSYLQLKLNKESLLSLKTILRDKVDIDGKSTPYNFLAPLGTHFFGGSAGREGVGVMLGASIASWTSRILSLSERSRSYILVIGVSAGFSSIFGTPLAAVVFSLEINRTQSDSRYRLLVASLFASGVAYFATHLFGPTHFSKPLSVAMELNLFLTILICGVSSGIGGGCFAYALEKLTSYWKKFSLIYSFFFVSMLISGLVYSFELYDYVGLGMEMIEKSFHHSMQLPDFLWKFILTILTLSVGFKGGEVTPAFFMGAMLSNFLCGYFDLDLSLATALGMMSFFGAISGAPIAASFMAAEVFGWEIGLISLPCCYIARYFMFGKSVYRTQ